MPCICCNTIFVRAIWGLPGDWHWHKDVKNFLTVGQKKIWQDLSPVIALPRQWLTNIKKQGRKHFIASLGSRLCSFQGPCDLLFSRLQIRKKNTKPSSIKELSWTSCESACMATKFKVLRCFLFTVLQTKDVKSDVCFCKWLIKETPISQINRFFSCKLSHPYSRPLTSLRVSIFCGIPPIKLILY